MTRLKENADYGVVENLAVPQRRGVLRDQVIFFYKLAKQASMHTSGALNSMMKKTIGCWCFSTSHMELAAATIAAVYKERWQIELFFRA